MMLVPLTEAGVDTAFVKLNVRAALNAPHVFILRTDKVPELNVGLNEMVMLVPSVAPIEVAPAGNVQL